MTNKVEEIQGGSLDKALSEMDDLNKKDKLIFRVDSDTFRFKDAEYKLIEDYKEAFDLEMMEERFTDYLLKYDYIVGDIAYEKLRLRGFYDDHRKGVPIDMKISKLEDYLIEYCNFGCKYFVFERSEKKKADPESYFKRNKKPNKSRKTNPRTKRTNPTNPKNRNTQPNKNKPTNQTNKKQSNKNEAQKEFQVVKKQESKPKPTPQKAKSNTKQKNNASKPKRAQNKKQFEIRKKTD